ncbi:hypothetical protein NsoK4_09915 [Nitrosopumilus sp. K4]|uniref:hypothetical protein n=1 Tax=Nitrosopumilus sp. K4 TaxID=2795383 RepID=UPI001BA9F889|nr:hypothetical protein [Nitrosopumilus sp. K4]QUC64707.1 hypothetical protein NsoK4_09915 [Nitrosopumilus sp. K4]
MTTIKMSSFRGTNSFMSVPVKSLLIGTNNRKYRTVIRQAPKNLRIVASKGTKTIQIERTMKNTVPTKTLFIVGNRGTKSSVVPITN